MAIDKYGARLKKLRELAGVSQAAVANHLGYTREYISMVEAGFRSLGLEDAHKAELFLEKEQSKKAREFTACRMDSAAQLARA